MDRRIPAVLSAGLLTLAAAPAAWAQASDQEMRQEIEALKQGQQLIRKDLADIKRLLQQQKSAPPASGPNVAGKVFDLGANPVKGQPTAKLTLIEFLDYQ
jgi:protein-disulfide isomerase